MRKLILAAVPLLCLLLMAGCSTNSKTEHAAAIDGIPADARLLYSNTAGANGTGVKTDPFETRDDVGFFVVEILQRGGELQSLRLDRQDGGTVASFGDIRQDAVYITDLVTDAADSYVLHFGKMKQFSGDINVYFVAGIGYSMED